MTYEIDKKNPVPRYAQIRRVLEDAIRSGKYPLGARLPGERELAAMFGVSQMTVNKAIISMVQDGWLRREVGNGTFVDEKLVIPALASATIGFAVPVSSALAEDDIYVGSLLRGIQLEIMNRPVSLKVIEAPPESLYESIAEANVDGCILTDVIQTNLADIERLTADGLKILILGADEDPLHTPYIDSDNVTGTQEAVEYLLGLGHRRVAGAFAYMEKCNSRQRLLSFKETLEKHEVPLPDSYVLDLGSGESVESSKYDEIAALLTRPDRPTAVVCGGFYATLDIMRAARDVGLSIPEDISVVGFDDPLAARYLVPPLTTVRQPLAEMGARAMAYLADWLLHNTRPPQRTVLSDIFVVRSSAAQAPETRLCSLEES